MKLHKRGDGFSLIELMIVVAIIGVLSSIAVPAYRDYMLKAKLSELISYGGNLTNTVALYLNENGKTSLDCSGMPNAGTNVTVTAKYTALWNVSTACLIVVTAKANELGSGQPTVTFTGTMNTDGSIGWVCSSTSKYAPANCACPTTSSCI